MKIVAVSGLGELDQRTALLAWLGVIGLTGLIFWATLSPPKVLR